MAFDDKIYLAFSSGNDGTGVVNNHLLPFKTFDGSAKALVEAGAVGQYEIIFTESTSENCNLEIDYSDRLEPGIWCRISFLKGVVAQGTGSFMRYNQGKKELEFHGCVVKDYTYLIERYDAGYTGVYSGSRLYNCYLENVNTRTLWYGTTVIDGCYFKNALIQSSSEVNRNKTKLIKNTTFDAATSLGLVMIGAITVLENVIFKRSSLSLGYLSKTNVTINRLFFEDCSFRFATINVFNGALEVCNNVAEFEAKWLSDTGATASTNWTENINFGAIEQTKGLLDSEDYYIDKKAVGYGRYGLTYDAITNTTANSDFIIDSGKIKRNVATDATLVFNIDLVKAVRLRRVFLHYDYLGGAEFPNNVLEGGAVKFSIETSLDGISYNSPFDYYGGVDINADLNLFDNVVAKSLRVSITISGADVGELLIESLSVEYQDYPSLEDYNCKQLGDDNGWYLLRETSIGIWESAYKIDINPTGNQEVQSIFDAATGFTQVSKLTAQQLMDALSTSTDLQGLFLEDRGEVVGVDDEETNITIITVNTATPIPIYTLKKL